MSTYKSNFRQGWSLPAPSRRCTALGIAFNAGIVGQTVSVSVDYSDNRHLSAQYKDRHRTRSQTRTRKDQDGGGQTSR